MSDTLTSKEQEYREVSLILRVAVGQLRDLTTPDRIRAQVTELQSTAQGIILDSDRRRGVMEIVESCGDLPTPPEGVDQPRAWQMIAALTCADIDLMEEVLRGLPDENVRTQAASIIELIDSTWNEPLTRRQRFEACCLIYSVPRAT